ncbi:integrase catalytic domain-containing protein [Trichonephila clavipes]|nr:integrase catalytic domain-containing protein [Trichonephila clavipes]
MHTNKQNYTRATCQIPTVTNKPKSEMMRNKLTRQIPNSMLDKTKVLTPITQRMTFPADAPYISNAEIPKFLTLADKSFYEANEVHALISADIFFKVLKQNTYKVNEELFFKESEFGWIACGHKKDGRLTSKTRIVFDAGSHQNNELSLNYCLWPGINLNPNLLDILINFRLNAIALCSDIKQAFLQICLADEHKDAVRFLWSDDEPCVHNRPKLHVYRFNRVNFGVSSSPFLLAAMIRHHIEKYKHEFPDTVELLDRNFYVDDLISSGNEFEEALQTSRRAKNIMEAA